MKNRSVLHINCLTLMLLLFVSISVNSQELKKDSIKSMRQTYSSGTWMSGGINTSFISTPQRATSTLLTVTDGQTTYQASFGFMIPLLAEAEPNNPPEVIEFDDNFFIDLDETVELYGFDPDDDDIAYVIVEQPKNGTLTQAGQFDYEYTYEPLSTLKPGIQHRDTIRYKVVEVEGEKLESEVGLLAIEFFIEDEPHFIEFFAETAEPTTKKLEVGFSDTRFNEAYDVLVTYLDFTDGLNPKEETLINKSFSFEELSQNGDELTASFDISKTDHPYVFNATKVVLTAFVSTSTGFSDDDAFILENAATGAGGSVSEIIDYSLPQPESVRSEDGLFFTFATKRKTPENKSVELKLYAIELGNFDLSEADISITKTPITGTSTTPVLQKSTSNLKQWSITYNPKGEVGYLDSLEFSVNSKARSFVASSFAAVEVQSINDVPTLAKITNKATNEDQSLIVPLTFADPDNDVTILASSSNSKVSASVNDGKVTLSPSLNFNGKSVITVQLKEKGTTELYSKTQSFEVTINAVNDQPVMAAIVNQSVNEDNAFTIALNATDADAAIPVFGYSATLSDPSKATATIEGNLLRITPIANYNGALNVTVTADDRQGASNSVSTGEDFTLTINPVNDSPTVSNTIPEQKVIQGFPTYTLQLGQFFDDVETADKDLVYTISNSANFTFSLNNDALSVTAKNGQSGTENITITASDGVASTNQTVNFTLEALSADIQVANAINNVNVNEDFGNYQIDLSNVFADANNANAVFSYSLSGLSTLKGAINGQNLTINSTNNYSGTEKAFLIGTTNGKSAFVQFDINVEAVNDAPVLASISNQSIQEDFSLSGLFIQFSDVDNSSSQITATATSSNSSLVSTENITLTKSETGLSLLATPKANANGKTTITVKVNDGELSAEKSFELTVSSVNDAPVFGSSAVNNATEDSPFTIELAQMVSDIDGDALSFSFENLPSWLSLNGTQLSGTPNNSHVGAQSFAVTAIDNNGGGIRQPLAFNVINTNDAPTLLTSLKDQKVTEDAFVSFKLNTASFSDIDGDQLTFSSASSNSSWLNYDAQNNLWSGTPTNSNVGTATIVVTATDPSGLSISDSFDVQVQNTNDNPTDITLSALTIAENAVAGTVIGSLATIDVDAGDSHNYGFIQGAVFDDTQYFQLNGSDLVLNTVLDFETKKQYSINIQTTDSQGAKYTELFTIDITDVNEAPTAIALSKIEVDENNSTDIALADITGSDTDAGDELSFNLVDGEGSTDNGSFSLKDGKLFSSIAFNFEQKSSYSVRLKASDKAGLSYEEAFTITVKDAPEAPSLINLSANSISENSEIGSKIGDLSSIDEDGNESHSYTLVSGIGDEDNARFKIENSALLSNATVNFELKSSFTIRIKSVDKDGLSVEQILNLNALDKAEAPITINISATSIAENSNLGTQIADFTSVDEDGNDSHTYSLVNGEGDKDNALFKIENGKLLTNAEVNFEEKSIFEIRVQSKDKDGLTLAKSFTLNATDVAEAPTAIELSASSINENSDVGTKVGELTTVDQDNGDSHTYTFVKGTDGDDNSSFSIDGTSLLTNSEIDYETKNSYSVRVESTDKDGLTVVKTFTIGVTNIAEPAIAGISDGVFESTEVGESTVQSFLVENTGDTKITVTSIDTPEDFSVSTQTFEIEVGQTYELEVTFAPSQEGTYNGTVTLNSNAGQSSFNVSGEGTVVTSIDDEKLDANEISIYPNPAKGKVTIDFKLAPSITPDIAIFQSNGTQKWAKKSVKGNSIEVDVSSYEAGIYLISIVSERGIVVKKLMVID